MARVNSTEVKAIMDNCTLDESVVDVYIGAAHEFIDQIFSEDTSVGTVLRKEIERWLTAHMIASTRHRMASEEKIGDAAVVYTGKWGTGLNSTSYGQMVLQLDTSGLMAKTGKLGASVYAIPNFDD